MKKMIFILAASAVLMLSCDDAMKEPYPDEPNGCDKPERYDCSTGPFKDLKGTEWRAVGFVDIRTGVLRKLDPTACMTRFTLRFTDDGYLLGITVVNSLWGRVEINYEECSIKFLRVYMTLLVDPDDGFLFSAALLSMHSFAITANGELMLYSFVSEYQVWFHHLRNIINYSYLLFERTDL